MEAAYIALNPETGIQLGIEKVWVSGLWLRVEDLGLPAWALNLGFRV